MEGGVSDRHKPRGRSRGRRFLRRSHRRLKLQQVDFRQHGRAPWCGLTVSGQGGAFGSLAAAALRAGASADSGILSRNRKLFSKTSFVRKATPFWGAETIFGQVFGRGGMSEIPKTKVPLRGPSASQMTFEGTDLGLGAARLCSLLRPSQTHRSLA